MLRGRLFLCLLLIFAAATASHGANSKQFLCSDESLCSFAKMVVSGNRGLLAAAHELEGAMLEKHKALSAFSPQFGYNLERSKSANRSFNPVTGVEEDYSTRREGSAAGLSQRTPLGRLGYDYSLSRTEYTSAQTSYFSSLYLSWQAGLLRNDARLNSLERRMIHANYQLAQAQTDALLLDVMLASLQSLFNRVISARNAGLRRQNLSFFQILVEEAEIKLQNGMGSELDLKQASMRYRQAETEQDEVNLALRDQDRRLAAQLGVMNFATEIASFSLDTLIAAIPGDLNAEELVATALKHRPDYLAFESRYRLRKAAFDRAREMSRPDVSARLRWGKQGRSFEKSTAEAMNDKSWDFTIAYNTSFGPDGNKIDFTIEKETLKAFKARLEQKRDDVMIAVQQAFERLMFYRKNLASLQDSEKLAAEVLEGQKLNFQLGKISLLDLTRYQQDFNSAGLALAQGESRLIMSWLELLFETGQLADYLQVKPDVSALKFHDVEIVPLAE